MGTIVTCFNKSGNVHCHVILIRSNVFLSQQQTSFFTPLDIMGAGGSASRQSPLHRGNAAAVGRPECGGCNEEVEVILSQLKIKSLADTERMKAKLSSLRTTRTGGLALLRALHAELVEIETEKKDGKAFLAVVAQARSRVKECQGRP